MNLLGLAAITPATWLAAPLGARLAHALPRVWLRRAFALFLSITAVRMLAELRGCAVNAQVFEALHRGSAPAGSRAATPRRARAARR